jgi:hypothetical protein
MRRDVWRLFTSWRSLIDNRLHQLPMIDGAQEITSELAADVARSNLVLRQLLTRIAEIAQPEQNWARVLKVLAKIPECGAEWLEGELQVDLRGGENNTTSLELYSVLGVGIRERIFPMFKLNVPIDEFQRAILLAPEVIHPLRAHQGLERLTLTMGMRVRSNDIPDFEVEEKAKGDGERITAPPPALEDSEAHTRPTAPPPASDD